MKQISKKEGKLLGFRSGNTIKKLISILYLIFCFVFLIAGLCISRVGQISLEDFIIDKIVYVIITFWFLSPYLFLSNTNFRNKLPFFKAHNIKSSILGIVFVSLIFVSALSGAYILHSDEYKEDMKNHAFRTEVFESATCTSNGIAQYICDYCGTTSEEEIIALGHKMVEISRKDATYIENGEIVRECEICGEKEVVVLEKLVNSVIVSENYESIISSFESQEYDSEESTFDSSFESSNYSTENNISDNSQNESDEFPTNLSCFQRLNDEQFSLLTEMVAKSFYTFSLNEEDYEKLESDSDLNECLKKIYDYAYSNYFELEPEYKIAASERYDVISLIPNYKELQEKFILEYYRDVKINEWIFNISSYTIDPQNTYKGNGRLYLDAEGYLNPGVIVYWEEDGEYIKVGEIEDIAYKKQIGNTYYGYAIKIKYYDDPYSSGWRDGENMLTTNKNVSGKPILYIDALDENRRVAREVIEYSTGINWKSLTRFNAKAGTEVYIGLLNAKSYLFKIVLADENSDIMLVEYPNGNIETKSYSAMVNSPSLYIK